MNHLDPYDFQVPVKDWTQDYHWVEDFQVSPDGKKIAAIVNLDEAEFSVCVNGERWDERFEKAWSLKFASDSSCMALVSRDEEWTICKDDRPWETWFDFIWNLGVSDNGRYISAAVQNDMAYGLVVNDEAWPTFFNAINAPVLTNTGCGAAVVQMDHMDQADIDGFSRGLFAAAVNGRVQTDRFMNIWDLTFNEQGSRMAYTVRKDRTRYTVGVDRQLWSTDFQFAWNPVFVENGDAVIASVRQAGEWKLFKNDKPLWHTGFGQLWKLTPFEEKIAAVVSDRFGLWTVCENETPWDIRCNTMISDLIYSGDGRDLYAVCKHNGCWDIAVNGTPWGIRTQRLWPPVISPDSRFAVARAVKNGSHHLFINGNRLSRSFDQLFDPVFSSDGTGLVVKSIKNGIYSRQVIDLEGF